MTQTGHSEIILAEQRCAMQPCRLEAEPDRSEAERLPKSEL
jgi:hypothetical protein